MDYHRNTIAIICAITRALSSWKVQLLVKSYICQMNSRHAAIIRTYSEGAAREEGPAMLLGFGPPLSTCFSHDCCLLSLRHKAKSITWKTYCCSTTPWNKYAPGPSAKTPVDVTDKWLKKALERKDKVGQTCQSSSKQMNFRVLNPPHTRNIHLTKQEAIFETLQTSVELFVGMECSRWNMRFVSPDWRIWRIKRFFKRLSKCSWDGVG